MHLGRGLAGIGGGSSEPLLVALSGGLLKGEHLSTFSFSVAAWVASGRKELRTPMLGFSALFTGGGGGFASCGLRNSADLRGGGGEGGLDAVGLGYALASTLGV